MLVAGEEPRINSPCQTRHVKRIEAKVGRIQHARRFHA